MRKKIGNAVKIIGKIWNVIVFTGAIILLALRFVPVLFGYEPIWCMSNSMAPAFHQGALCYVDTNYNTNAIETGDIIAYQMADGSLVTHRVYDITENGIITKGDANENVDFAPIVKEQIIGENVLQIEYIGNLFKGFPNILLISIIVFAVAVMMSLDILSSLLLEEEANDEKKDKMDIDHCDSGADID